MALEDVEAEDVECAECGWTGSYTLTNDGRILDPCPECGADALTETNQ